MCTGKSTGTGGGSVDIHDDGYYWYLVKIALRETARSK